MTNVEIQMSSRSFGFRRLISLTRALQKLAGRFDRSFASRHGQHIAGFQPFVPGGHRHDVFASLNGEHRGARQTAQIDVSECLTDDRARVGQAYRDRRAEPGQHAIDVGTAQSYPRRPGSVAFLAPGPRPAPGPRRGVCP